MKVVCINNIYFPGKKFRNLTLYKIYETMEEKYHKLEYYCRVVDDNDMTCLFPKDKFLYLEEFRDQKLEKLLE